MPTKKPKVFVVHLGCAKNQVDAENLVGEMLHAGFATCDSAAKADYILVNTCGFIEAAKEESINAILAQISGKKPKQKLIVSGCLSGRYGDELIKELPEVDYWVGTYKPGELLKKMGIVAPQSCDAENLPRMNLGGFKHHAYLQGVKEITLIAQDTTYFGREKGKKGGTLAQLLRAILDNTSIPWIRTLYWYPMFVDDELLDLMANEPRLVKYVDMPIQHASDNVLKNMKRNYRKKELVDILHKIRKRIPGVTLRTTVLVGFPGETHEDFEELMELLEDIQFDHLGGFVFSPEEGTPVMEMNLPAVDESEARARLDAVTDLQEEIDAEHAEAMIGKTVRIIIDQEAEESEYHFYGRTEGNSMENDDIVKVLEGDADVGEFRDALVVDAEPHELIVKLI